MNDNKNQRNQRGPIIVIEEAQVPYLIGKTREDAIKELNYFGLKAEVKEVKDLSYTENTVIDTDPAPFSAVSDGSTVVLTIATK